MFFSRKNVLSGLLALSLTSVSYAQIPVTDGAQISISQLESAKQLAEMAQQLSTAKSQLDTAMNQLNAFKNEAESMKRRLEGISNFSDVLSNKELNSLLEGFINDVAEVDVNEAYSELGINGKNFDENTYTDSFKRDAKQSKRYGELIDSLAEKDAELSRLRDALNTADTPQKREEMSNVIALEQLAQSNLNKAVEYQTEQEKVKRSAKEEAERKEFFKQQMTLPSWFKE